MDGVFDLIHYGHIRAINKCKAIGGKDCQVIIGIISDNDTASYKRHPIYDLEARTEIILNLKVVDEVVSPAPLIVTKDFIKNFKIDKVVHAFADDDDFERQKDQHKELIEMGIFERIPYTSNISTTDIITKIKTNY